MPELVDMHCHVVWGVDDGARSRDEMRAMLELAAGNHVKDLVCTSHISPGEAPFPLERYERHLAEGQAWADEQGLGLTLHPGSEILYTDAAPRLVQEGVALRLNGQRAVLVEFWHDAPETKLIEAARLLGNEGLTVIFAHIERYRATHSIPLLEELRGEYGVLLQMNVGTILKRLPFFEERWKRKVLRQGLVDLVASDAHSTHSRPCNLLAAWERLREEFGQETADRLCGGLARELLHL